MLRTENGWLTMLPLKYNGETAKAVDNSDVAGEYEAVFFSADTKATDDWSKVNDIIEPVSALSVDDESLTVDGKETELKLSEDSYTFSFELDGENFYGAFCAGTQNGKTVMTLSAVSDKNRTLWAVAK